MNEKQQIEVTLEGSSEGRHCGAVTVQATGVTDRAEACTTWAYPLGLRVEVSSDLNPVEESTNSTFSITIFNQGRGPLTNVAVVASTGTALQYVSHTAAPSTRGTPGERDGESWLVSFTPYQVLNGGEQFTHRVTIKALGVKGQEESDIRFVVEVTADELTLPIIKQRVLHLPLASSVPSAKTAGGRRPGGSMSLRSCLQR